MTAIDDYTVAIPANYRPELLDGLLDSLERQTASLDELLIIDAGDKETSEVVQKHTARFEADGTDVHQYHNLPDTESLQQIRNRIIDLATGDVLCFLDDDTVCTERWLQTIKETYERDPEIVCVGGPAIRSDTDRNPSDDLLETDEKLNTLDQYGFVTDMSGRWVPPASMEVDVCRGANMAFRKSALEEIGGFDTDYGGPGIFEEWDVMAKLKQMGGRLVYHPDAFVYHFESKDGGSRLESHDGPPGSYWFARNSVVFRKKNFSETYYRSLVKQCVSSERQLPPMWKRLVSLGCADTKQIPWIRGFFDGIRGAERD